MPFQPINFANIDPIGLPSLSAFGEGFGKGVKNQREEEQAALVNAINQMKLKYMPQEFESQRSLRVAQAQKAQEEAAKQKMLSDILRQHMQGGNQDDYGVPVAQNQRSELREALFRKLAGLPEELPGEKQSRELSTFKQKEEWKKDLEKRTGDVLTGQSKSKLQDTVAALDRVIPDLKELIKITPGKLDISGRAAWNRKQGLIADKLMKAQQLGANVPQLNTIKEILNRGWNESTPNYLKDMQGLVSDLESQRDHGRSSLEAGKVLPYEPKRQDSPEMQKVIGGKTYFKRDGKWFVK